MDRCWSDRSSRSGCAVRHLTGSWRSRGGAALEEAGIDSFEKLLGLFVAGPAELRAFVGDGPLLTDDRPLTEYFLSLPRDRQPDLRRLKGDIAPFIVPD
jgi:hypothetical protein